MNCFTECIYLELKTTGSKVHMQSLCPGFTHTEFHDVLGVERNFISGGWWMSAEDVVNESLDGLKRESFLSSRGGGTNCWSVWFDCCHESVVHYALTRGPASFRRERKPSSKSSVISCQ